MKKSELRKEIKNRKRQFTSQQLSELSFAVIMRLLAHQRLKDARTVMLYYSLPDEVYTTSWNPLARYSQTMRR